MYQKESHPPLSSFSYPPFPPVGLRWVGALGRSLPPTTLRKRFSEDLLGKIFHLPPSLPPAPTQAGKAGAPLRLPEVLELSC